jgi:NAD(P)-dependent dehydrogenase (short-subunit alcohol dehydrogenase family)
MLRFDGRVAVVTGAGRGLGRAHAMTLAARGAAVVVNDLGGELDGTGASAEPADQVVAEIRAAGGTAVADHASVASAAGGAGIVHTALDAFGRLDIVVNNAGTTGGRLPFADISEEQLSRVLGSHLLGTYHVTRAAWDVMARQGYGRVVTTTSGVGLWGMANASTYAAAKMGIVGLSSALAQEGADLGIRVNAVAPVARTRMAGDTFDSFGARFDPELVSAVVAYLAHEDCSLAGRIISAGAGRVAEVFIATGRGLRDAELTPEAVAAHLPDVLSRVDPLVPADALAEVALAAEAAGD